MQKNILNSAITHQTKSHVPYSRMTEELILITKERLEKSSQLNLTLPETLDLLQQLSEFDLGRFLLHNQGLNGYWTSYIFQYNENYPLTHPLEKWLLTKSLFVIARERLATFQRLITNKLKSNMVLASLPCGLMDDLLHLDYSGFKNISLFGIDADSESLEYAKENAKKRCLEKSVNFLCKDAWQLDIESQFDLLTSNGLNMYESDEGRLISLYKNFYKALKPGGVLVMSFLPPPPAKADLEEIANLFKISPQDWKKERSLFGDIIQIKYLNFCTEESIIKQLEIAQFKVDEIIYNKQGVAPVLIAYK